MGALRDALDQKTRDDTAAEGHLHLNGYGFPSSHSQYMGYFGAFLVCHMYLRHRFASTGYPLADQAFRFFVYLTITTWVVLVAYSRSYGLLIRR